MQALRILFFISDSLTSDVRISPLLAPLIASDRVRLAYVNRDMKLSGNRSDRYSVLIAHRSLGRRQISWLREHDVPFVYDIDDLLVCDHQGSANETRGHQRLSQQEAIRWCLKRASAVTSPSQRLLAELDRRLGGGVLPKATLLPNPGQAHIPPPKPPGQPAILWTSSAEPLMAPDLDEACAGICDAAAAKKLPFLLIGRFSASLFDVLKPHRSVAWLEADRYLELLGRDNLIAVAPLSQQLPSDLQTFSDCKSDIKIAQYASSRVPGVYSPAPPFVDSDLPRRIARDNSRAAWRDAIIELAEAGQEDAGNGLAEMPAVLARRPSVLAEVYYQVLCEVAAQSRPFAFHAVPTPKVGRRIEEGLRSIGRRLSARDPLDEAL